MSSNAASVAHETVNDLFNRVIGPLAATQIGVLLVEPDNIEERVGVLVAQFNLYPHLISPFRKLVQSIQNKEASLEEQIRFYQTKHTRNWLLVNLFDQVLQVKELKLDMDSGRLPGKPHDLLKFSHTAQVAFGEESRYKDLVCATGLIFDFLMYLQKTTMLELNGAKFDEPITQAFTKAIEQGKLITRLARHKSKLSYEKHAPISAMMRQLGQLVLMLLRPNSAPDFYKKLSALRCTEPFKNAMEMQEFGVHSGMIASYLAQSFDLFEPLGEAMSVWGMPHIAYYTNSKEIYDLVGMGELGASLKETFKPTEFPEAGTVGNTIPELEFLDFTLNSSARADLASEGKK